MPHANSLKWNTVANMAGRLWTAALSILTVPVFVRVLGPEAYGLVGLFSILQALFAILDLGLSATVNREIARNVASGKPNVENRALLRTLETLYWFLSAIFGTIIFLGSGWISTHWVIVTKLTASEVRLAFVIMGLSLAARWPVSLYTGVLQGLQKQVLQNAVFGAAATLRTLGALAVVFFISPTITAFLITQAIANVIEVTANMVLAWTFLSGVSRERVCFKIAVIKNTWRFALSFNAIGALGMIVSSADRLVISKYLPLEQLGYYAVASTVANAMPLIGNSVATALFPRFAAQALNSDKSSLWKDYHGAVQVIAFFSVGFSLAAAFFSYDLLITWTHSINIAEQTWSTMSFLAIAGLFLSVWNPAYVLLVSHGYTKVPLWWNILALTLYTPIIFLVVPRNGIWSAAMLWMILNILYGVVYSASVRDIFSNDQSIYMFMRDIFPYVLAGLFWIGSARLIAPPTASIVTKIILLLIAEAGYFGSILYISKYMHIFPYSIPYSSKDLQNSAIV